MNFSKIYTYLKLIQDVVGLLVPAVELLIKRDLNNNGKIGE